MRLTFIVSLTASGDRKGRSGFPIGPFCLMRFYGRRLFEHQHCACDFAGFHRAECFVDVLELAATRDHVVEVEAALLIELDDARHVDAETVRAHEASLDALLVQQREAVDVDLLAEGTIPTMVAMPPLVSDW